MPPFAPTSAPCPNELGYPLRADAVGFSAQYAHARARDSRARSGGEFGDVGKFPTSGSE
jgi:hypothetical protein